MRQQPVLIAGHGPVSLGSLNLETGYSVVESPH